MILTHPELLLLLRYEPGTGRFFWLVDVPGIKAGGQAGGPTGNGYWRIRVKGARYLAHRLAWFYVHGSWPVGQVDHRFGDGTDNRPGELRDVTPHQNCQNLAGAHRDSSLKTLGVRRLRNRFQAAIQVNNVRHHLGTFDTEVEAGAAYAEAKKRLAPHARVPK